jgi:hypothetical protein
MTLLLFGIVLRVCSSRSGRNLGQTLEKVPQIDRGIGYHRTAPRYRER